MRLVSFQVNEHPAHVGVIRDDNIVDLTLWVAPTGLATSLPGSFATPLFPGTSGAGQARWARRQDTLADLWGNSSQIDVLEKRIGAPLDEPASTAMAGSGSLHSGEHGVPLPLPFDMLGLIGLGDTGLGIARLALAEDERALREDNLLIPLSQAKLTAPIPRPRKNIMCLGRNYAEHAAESIRARREKPPKNQQPAIFTKAPTSVIGPYDPIPYDANITEELDWECELAVVIGRGGRNIAREDAFSRIFGYMVLDDVSARDIQYGHGGQYFKGKSLDGLCPTGPWIVTTDELTDPDNLELWTRISGVEKQHDNTSSMIIDIAGIVEMISFGLTLEPGDIIATGTPQGVGFARTPPEYLKPGDVVECHVDKIGSLKNIVGEST